LLQHRYAQSDVFSKFEKITSELVEFYLSRVDTEVIEYSL